MVSPTQLLAPNTLKQLVLPSQIAEGLKAPDIPQRLVDEALACAWESVTRHNPALDQLGPLRGLKPLILIMVVAEFKGELVQVQRGDDILGYNVQELLDTLFRGTSGYARNGPETGSDCGTATDRPVGRCCGLGLQRHGHVWFSENEWQILMELGTTMYDAVAFYKHRAEGETNNTFAYVSPKLRTEAYRVAREVLWALDAAQAAEPAWRIVLNFLRSFGGPIQTMMRRYRFVEQGLTIGMPEDTR
ncbi:hypothetical protein B0H14DRAFT_3545356, partial [Mycena olivaceomarginata]